MPSDTSYQIDVSRHFLSLAEWPEADRLAWARALSSARLLEDGGAGAHWAANTKKMIASAYSRWLAWLAHAKPDALTLSPGDRITKERVIAYIEAVGQQVASSTMAIYIRDLRYAVAVIAPDHDWQWLRRLSWRLKRRAVPARDKRSRVVPAKSLYDCGLALMAKAGDPASGTPLQCAGLYRDGLIISFMAALPLRLSNFTLIRIGHHLIARRHGYSLHFEPDETKTRTDMLLDIPFSEQRVPLLNGDLDGHRLVLARRQVINHPGWSRTDRLWVSRHGAPMSDRAIYSLITKHTCAAFGRAVNPHLFRDCTATSIAIDLPAYADITRQILGHATMETSRQHYNHAGTADASQRMQAVIAKLRRRPGI